MPKRTYTIGEVSASLGVTGKNSSTLRLWTRMFADCLSPTARPDKGRLRLYSEDDVRTLKAIRDLRRRRVSYDEIRDRLKAGDVVEVTEGGAEVVPAQPERAATPLVGVEDLREVLAPVLMVAERLGNTLSEIDSTRMRMEYGRLSASIDSLENSLGQLREEIRVLRLEWVAVGSGLRGSGGSVEPHGGRESVRLPVSEPGLGVGMVARGAGSEPSMGLSPAQKATPPDKVTGNATAPGYSAQRAPVWPGQHPGAGELNEHGLHPLPPRLAVHPLGALYSCPQCGSETRPLGVTPTSRGILACLECGERTAVPLESMEKAVGLSKGFWARLWSLFRK